MTSLNTRDNTLNSTLWKTRAKVYIEVLILHWDLYFPWKNGMRNQFLQTGFIKGSGHTAIISSSTRVQWIVPNAPVWGHFRLPFASHFFSLDCGRKLNFSHPWTQFNFTIPGSQVLNYLVKCFLFLCGPKRICNLYLHLNLTWLHLREKVSSIRIQNILLPNSRILW